jgi:hypothetical protein
LRRATGRSAFATSSLTVSAWRCICNLPRPPSAQRGNRRPPQTTRPRGRVLSRRFPEAGLLRGYKGPRILLSSTRTDRHSSHGPTGSGPLVLYAVGKRSRRAVGAAVPALPYNSSVRSRRLRPATNS